VWEGDLAGDYYDSDGRNLGKHRVARAVAGCGARKVIFKRYGALWCALGGLTVLAYVVALAAVAWIAVFVGRRAW
jgi:hypothetical protein